MTKGDVLVLQRLQNKVMRLVADVHPLCAMSTLRLVGRAMTVGSPKWLAAQLPLQTPTRTKVITCQTQCKKRKSGT